MRRPRPATQEQHNDVVPKKFELTAPVNNGLYEYTKSGKPLHIMNGTCTRNELPPRPPREQYRAGLRPHTSKTALDSQTLQQIADHWKSSHAISDIPMMMTKPQTLKMTPPLLFARMMQNNYSCRRQLLWAQLKCISSVSEIPQVLLLLLLL